MARLKLNYAYWELPKWDNEEVFVGNIYTDKGKVYLVLHWNNKVYKIKKPKLGGWDKIKPRTNIKITKNMYGPKNARIAMQAIDDY